MKKYYLSKVDPNKPGEQVIQDKNGKVIDVVIVCGESKTEQAHRDECNMNYILREYQKTGLIRHAKEYEGRYDDIAVQDFQDAMFLVTEAQNMFNGLPNNIRQRFENDPGKFLAFVQNPDNKPEMKVLGMLKGNDGLDARGQPTAAPQADKPQPTPTVDTNPDKPAPA
jgi:phage internal scaffolding protein